MKKILFFIFATCVISFFVNFFCFAYPKQNSFPPFRIMDNLYYVGADDLASYLIVTSKGNILINSNLESDVSMIKDSIEKLGFKYEDIKILVISHAHFDHAAGSALIKQQTHAKYMVMDADVDLVQSGGKSDFYYYDDESTYFRPSIVDRVLHDGDKIRLGETELTAHLTPGHTKGCTSWTIQLNEKNNKYQAVIVGSLSVNPGYQLVQNKKYPTIAKDYMHAIKTLKSLSCDIFLGSHGGYFDLKKKYQALNDGKINPFIDPEGCKNYILQKERDFYVEFSKQKSIKK